MLAILAAIKKWNACLISCHFQIKTDHFSLKFLLDQQTNTSAQQKWVVKMMGYDFELLFRKGSSNTVADAFSRQPEVQLSALTVVTSDLMQIIQQSWISDSDLVHLMHIVKRDLSKHPKYSWHSNQLRRSDKLVIGNDSKLREDLL